MSITTLALIFFALSLVSTWYQLRVAKNLFKSKLVGELQPNVYLMKEGSLMAYGGACATDQAIYIEEGAGHNILKHELVHLKEKHVAIMTLVNSAFTGVGGGMFWWAIFTLDLQLGLLALAVNVLGIAVKYLMTFITEIRADNGMDKNDAQMKAQLLTAAGVGIVFCNMQTTLLNPRAVTMRAIHRYRASRFA